jgi:hypothetical protein
MTRWKAAGAHLCLSIVIIGGIATFAFTTWYPQGLWLVAGLDRLLLVMLGIDLTAGPLLTLLLYKPGKWGLKFDLATIAVLQMAFLVYGLHTLWLARPVFLVGTSGQFTVVFASEIDDRDLAKGSKPEWRRLSWTGPEVVGTQMPNDPAKRAQAISEFMAGGAGIERSPKYYLDLAVVAPELLRTSQKVRENDAIPTSAVRATGLTADELRWVPIVSTRGEGIALLDARTGEPLSTIATDP